MSATQNRRILVIDDNEAIHQDFRKVLRVGRPDTSALDDTEAFLFGEPTHAREPESFEIDGAIQGQEGFELVRRAIQENRPYALAFVDVRMPPGWDGIETIARIWEEDPEIQTIICTAYSDYSVAEILSRLQEPERLLILKKPFDIVEVHLLVRCCLEKWHLGRQANLKLTDLQAMVDSRTRELEEANDELRWLNESLAAAHEAAERANQTKSEFLANMSHEIRTPMTAVLGFAETLLDDGLSNAERTESIQTIQRSGQHLLDLINDILDLSKIEAGRLEIERVRFSPVELVDGVHSMMNSAAEEKALTFDVEYDGAIPESIASDQFRLRQILTNLLSNAVKFTEEGSIQLIVDLASDSLTNDPRLRFRVIDTGIGMSQEQQDGIFSPFAQADTSTTRKYGGTGLGLTISKRLAKMLGGFINVDSAPGEGSTFTLLINPGPLGGVEMIDSPAQLSHQAKPTEAQSSDRKLHGHILLAEDGPDNQRLISYILEKAGAKVTVVENGRLAVEQVCRAQRDRKPDADPAPFDLILMDMQMPEMDGYVATRKLREAGYIGPIIALTAHAMTGDRERCLKAGCDDYLSKPVDREGLLRLVASHLRNSQRGPGTETIDFESAGMKA